MYRVTTVFSGSLVNGGGIQQFYFDQGSGTAAQAHAAAVLFWQAADDIVHSSVTYRIEGEVELVDNVTGAVESITSTDTYNGTGGNTGDPLPPQIQGLVRWRTGVYNNGREIRGRTFIPGMCEGNSTDGAPTSGTVTQLQTAAGAILAASGADLVVWSRKGTFAPVAAGSPWNKWATLRSRRD